MWSTKHARALIARARQTDDVLANELATYLTYAIDSMEYYRRDKRR